MRQDFGIQRHRPMTKAIIFDLDSCLAAADEVGEQLFAPAFAAIRAANDGSVLEETLRAAFAECWRVAFDAVAMRARRLNRVSQSSGSVPSLRI